MVFETVEVGSFEGWWDSFGAAASGGSLVASGCVGRGVWDLGGQDVSFDPLGGRGGKQLFNAARVGYVPGGGLHPC